LINKVCIVAPSLQMGGIERSLTLLANYLNLEGVEVHFVTMFPFKDFFSLENGIVLHRPELIFFKKDQSFWKNFFFYVRMVSPMNGKIISTINKISPDLVISYGDWYPHLIMLGLRNRYPFVYSNRSSPKIRYSKPIEFVRWLAYKLTPPAGIIAQTSYAKARKQRILGDKIPIKIVPNPVLFSDLPIVEKSNWIVSVGRLHKEKGFIRLIEAYSAIRNKDWKLVLIGDGIHKIDIVNFVKHKGLENNVVFVGKVKDVASFLNQSKIFVLASHTEGFPNALLEAGSLGLPLISFDIVAGPSDIIENEVNGILLPDGDIRGLSRAIDRLIDDVDLRNRLGKNAKISSERFDINNLGGEIYSFLCEINSKWTKPL
jgi:GalNAc-alpha-(1->4)-GalNAc-alpha-(1->3)-diNAcBac-PP-undecaprenol alpha-1,4-N-acetyl-D-galactosaminyltransferase